MDDLAKIRTTAGLGDLGGIARALRLVAVLTPQDGIRAVKADLHPKDALAIARIIEARHAVRVVEVQRDLPLTKGDQLWWIWVLGLITYSALEAPAFTILRGLGLMP